MNDPKTEEDEAAVRGVPEAEGRAAVPRAEVPRAATKRTYFVIDVLHGFLR